MKINLYNLSVNQVFIIKGIAIILIVLHNFVHYISDLKENEIFFDPNVLPHIINVISDDTSAIFNGVLSYLGHFGVQLFIFLSGFGLTKKYLSDEKINYKKYIIPRLVKIYSLLITGLILYIVLNIKEYSLGTFVNIILSSLSLLNNLSYDRIYIYVGPWWFFSLIVQLYLIFPFLLKIIKKHKEKGLFILLGNSYLTIYILHPITERLNVPIFGNFPGHLPEFIVGIGFAYFKKFNINFKLFFIAVTTFIISNLNKYTFPLSFLSMTVILLVILYPLYNSKSNKIVNKVLLFVGKISMIMFVINGFLRSYMIDIFNLYDFSHLHLFFMSFLFLGIVITLSQVIYLLYNKSIVPLNKLLIDRLLKP